MSALSSSLVLSVNPRLQLSPGSSLKPLGSVGAANFLYGPIQMGNFRLSTSRSPLPVKARDGDRPDAASIFVGGFALEGAIVGTLGLEASLFSNSKRNSWVSSQMFSKALAGDNGMELLEEFPDFIYNEEKELEDNEKETVDEETEIEDEEEEFEDEEKEMERRRNVLANKIAEINAAMDALLDGMRSDEEDYDENTIYMEEEEEDYDENKIYWNEDLDEYLPYDRLEAYGRNVM